MHLSRSSMPLSAVILAILVADWSLGQARPPADSFEQARVDEAMGRLAKRQQERAAATTLPTTAPSGSAAAVQAGEYSDAKVESVRKDLVKGLIAECQDAVRSREPKRVNQLIADRKAIAAMPLDEIRPLLAQRDARQKAEIDRIAPKYANTAQVAQSACAWLRRSGSVRSARVVDASGLGMAQRDEKPFAVEVDFEFVTKSGLVRLNRGAIRFAWGRLPYLVPMAVNIDGIANGQAFPGVNDNPGDDVSLAGFNDSYGGRIRIWFLTVRNEKLLLDSSERSVDDP